MMKIVSFALVLLLSLGFAQTDDLGDFVVSYEHSSSDIHLDYANSYQELQFFEGIASGLNNSIALPYSIGIVSAQCDTVNAFWSPDARAIIMCYELTEYLFELFRAETNSQQELTNAVLGAVEFIFFHELGHALINTFGIPFTGREEDAVDQFSTIFLLGTELGVESALSGASFFYLSGLEQDSSELVFWDEHSLDQQRFYDIVCLVYGSDPETYKHLIVQQSKGFMLTSSTGYLPKDRAERCPSEHRAISNSWNTLFATFVPTKDGSTSIAEPTPTPVPASLYTESFTGSLASGDTQYNSEEFYDEINLELFAGQEAVFELSSEDFDTYLIVTTADGTTYVNDDFTNDNGFTSRLTVPIVESGEINIQVTSYEPSERGNYTLGVNTKDDVYQSIFEDSLTTDTEVFSETGEYYHKYSYDFAAGEHVVIALSSEVFDTYVYASSPSGENFVNDDYETMKSLSRIEFNAPESGTYNVYVTTNEVGEVGDYKMVIGQNIGSVLDDSDPEIPVTETSPPATDPQASTGSTTIDITDLTSSKARNTNLGVLEEGDDSLDAGELVDYYSVDMNQGQEAILTLVSADFNTYLGIMNPAGEVFETDEVADDPNRSRLTITAQESGTWYVFVTSVAPGEKGNYLLSIKK